MKLNEVAQALASEMQAFLSKGDIVIDKTVKPAWLLNDMSDFVWVIKDGNNTRKAGNEWKGAININWQMQLVGGGDLIDPVFSLLLDHLQILTLAHLECPVSGASTTKGIDVYANSLKGLAEWLVHNRREQALRFGMKALDTSAVEFFLADARRFGVGPAIWMECFDAFIRARYADPTEHVRVATWAAETQTDVLDLIDQTVLATRPPYAVSREIACFTLDEELLRWAKRLFYMQGWYQDNGLISLQRVADAINVDQARLSNHAQMRFYLRQFENLLDYSQFDFLHVREKIGHRQDTVGGTYRNNVSPNFLRLLNQRLALIPRYAPYCADLQDDQGLCAISLDTLPRELAGDMVNRTPSIPVDIALYIYDKAIHWALHYSGPLTDYYIQLLEWVITKSGRAGKRSAGIKAMAEKRKIEIPPDWWEEAFLAVPIPEPLKGLNIARFYGWPESGLPRNADGSYPLAARLRQAMTVEQAMQLNFACETILTAAFTVRRDDEIYGITRNSLYMQPGYGAYIDFALCKVQIDNVRLQQRRPIPNFLYNTLQHQRRLADRLSKERENKDELIDNLLFVYPARRNILIDPDSRTLRKVLDMFCDYIEVPCDEQDRRWYIRLHECRRFFALAFFWMHDDKCLEALSWFMGHGSPEDTWRYIKESLTGSEVTQIQAERTVSYIRKENTDAADALRKFAMRHFNVPDVNLVTDTALEAYLEYLLEEGCYTIEPHSLQAADGAYEMIVSIYKEPDDGTVESR